MKKTGWIRILAALLVMTVFLAQPVSAAEAKKTGLVTGNTGDIRILHFQVPEFGGDGQLSGFVGDGVFIRDDVAA